MTPCRLLLLTAVLPEARAIARAFSWDPRPLAAGSLTGSPDGTLLLANVGLRARHAPRVLAQTSPQIIIMTGLAGALAPHLQVGDIVLDTAPPSAPPASFSVHQGSIHTASAIVATPADKAALHARTGALAVDMETRVVADAARPRAIPVLAVRAISDAAHHPLDPRLLTLLDADGKPKLTRVAALLLRHPSALGSLMRIKRATDCALANLGTFLVHAAASRWPITDIPSRPPPALVPSPEKISKDL